MSSWLTRTGDKRPGLPAGLPLDQAQPAAERLMGRYKKLGGAITVIRKPGGKHHPHSLVDPAPIVDFAVSSSL